MIMTKFIKKADEVANEAHKGQFRKYKHENYIMHPRAVAEILANVNMSEATIVAGLLHDTVEDTYITLNYIREEFGEEVAQYVEEVTDIKDYNKNRATRKKISRERLSKASYEGKSIKLADTIHNLPSIISKDKDFAKIYVPEKLLLLPCLDGGNVILFKRLEAILKDYIGSK